MNEQDYMRLAIRKAQEGIAAGQSPFGSVIVRLGEVIAATHNSVWRDTDPTAHAEVSCIRAAATALKTIFLHGCVL
jgi:guanine deaminase